MGSTSHVQQHASLQFFLAVTVPFGSNFLLWKTFHSVVSLPKPTKIYFINTWTCCLETKYYTLLALLPHFICCRSLFELESRTWFKKITTTKNNHDSFKLRIRVAKSWGYIEQHQLFSKLVTIHQVQSSFKNKYKKFFSVLIKCLVHIEVFSELKTLQSIFSSFFLLFIWGGRIFQLLFQFFWLHDHVLFPFRDVIGSFLPNSWNKFGQ